jgi:hypothetical protein
LRAHLNWAIGIIQNTKHGGQIMNWFTNSSRIRVLNKKD